MTSIPGAIFARSVATGTVKSFPAELSIEHDAETDAYYVAVHDLEEDTERGMWLDRNGLAQLIAAAERALDRETDPGILNIENALSSADIAMRTESAGRARFRVILTPDGSRVI